MLFGISRPGLLHPAGNETRLPLQPPLVQCPLASDHLTQVSGVTQTTGVSATRASSSILNPPNPTPIMAADAVAHVASGSFQYTTREATTGQLAHITNGRFNVTL